MKYIKDRTISDLIKLFSEKDVKINHKATYLLKNKKIIVYGAGNGLIAFNNTVLKRNNLKPYLILDNKFKKGDLFFGVDARSMDDYNPSKSVKNDSIVIVTIGNILAYNKIKDLLVDKGFETVIRAHDIFDFNIHHIPPELKKEGRRFYLSQKDKIQFAFSLMPDVRSRDVFYYLIKLYLMEKPMYIPKNPEFEQNDPKDINLKKGYKRWINCGSFDGDTIKQIISKNGKIDALACFEPDLVNFHSLSKYLNESRDEIAEQIVAFPCGVFDQEVQLSFSGNKLLCSSLFDEGDQLIQCVSLDNTLPNFKPTFINMDIEGAELKALSGARNLLIENRPDLSISVYHFPNHTWEIPIFIHSLDLGYKFYLRNYSGFSYETLLYATIK